MKCIVTTILAIAILLAPTDVFAQRGGWGGGGGHGGGWGGGGGGGGYGGGHGGGYGGGGGGGANGGFRGGEAPKGVRTGAAGPGRGPDHMAHYAGWNHRPSYHGGWYHGDWHGPWMSPYAYRPYGWGWYGGWGLGVGIGMGMGMGYAGVTAPWSWGYYGYYNPYYTAVPGGVNYINYSQPVVLGQPQYPQYPPQYAAQNPPQYPTQYPPQYAAQNSPQYPPPYSPVYPPPAQYSQQPVPPSQTLGTQRQNDALVLFDGARNMFRQGSYQAALAQTDRAIGYVPTDGVMHEFRALCLFAMRDYSQAAAAVHAVTTSGPGWDWTTVSGLYADPSLYGQQLAALENYRTQHPEAAAPRFLLAYHYMLTSRTQDAATELAQVVRLEPRDQLASQLLKALTTPIPTTQPGVLPASGTQPLAGQPGAFPPTPGVPLTPTQPVDSSTIMGNWQATRPDGVKLNLTLTADKRFTWVVNEKSQPQKMAGTYTLADSFLILSAVGQSALVGNVSLQSDGSLNFKMAGASPADPGLTFARLP